MDIKVLSETGLPIQISDSLLTDVGTCGPPPPKKSLRDEIHFSIRNCYDEIIKGAYIMEKNHHMVVTSRWTSLMVVAKIQVETITRLNLNVI